MNRLQGKTVLITGATSGIGKDCAFEFAASGSNLILTGRREEKLKQIKLNLESKFNLNVEIACFDIQDYEQIQSFVSHLTTEVDILVNNAGLSRGLDPIFEADQNDWNEMIDTNIKGLVGMTRLIAEKMKAQNSGHIINVGSIAGHESYAGGVVYAATKHAVKAITEATKKDLHGTNVRVSMVSPGLVETEFSIVRFHGDENRAKSVYDGFDPLVGQDIAEIIVFIANRPAHVNIMDVIVLPTAQSSATMVHRNEKN